MPSTYTLNNGIELIATGEQSGTWGDTTNLNLGLVDTALDGQVTVTLPAAGTSGAPNALPISDGAASNGRNRLIIFADGGDLGATAFVQLTPNDAEKIVYIRNNLSGGRAIALFQGTYNAANDYEVPAGTTAVVFFNGGGAGAVAANVFNNAFFDSLRLGGVSVTAILDEDNMASDSATALATQQSIKAYVDAQVAANNELSEVLANGNTSGGTDIQMTTTDEVQFRDTALTIKSSVDGQLDIAADVELEIVAPTLDINASTAVTIDTTTLTMTGSVNVVGDLDVDNLNLNGNTIISTNTDGNIALTPNGTGEVDISKVDIDGGTIDGTVIGGSTPAAISGTTGSFSGNLTVDTNTLFVDAGTNNVGIGTSSPSYPLTVSGKISYNGAIGEGADNTLSSSSTTLILGESSTWQNLSLRTASTERMRIDSSGNVGIGTSSPSLELSVDGDIWQGNRSGVEIGRITNAAGWYDFGGSSNVNGAQMSHVGTLRFLTASTERMRIDSSGNVGIGTSSFAYSAAGRGLLEVNGSSSALVGLKIGDVAGGYLFDSGSLVSIGAPAGRSITFDINGERARIDASGNLGLGVTPSAWTTSGPTVFDIGARGALVDWSSAQQTDIWSNGYFNGTNSVYKTTANASIYRQSSGAHIFYTAPSGTAGDAITFTQAMTLDASGNLLVGTTTSGHKLIVADATNRTEATSQFRVVGSGYSFYTFLDASACHLGQNSNARAFRIYSGSNPAVGVNLAAGGTSWGTYSDERVKTALKPIEDALDKVSSLRAVTGRYLTDDETVSRSFLVAQDVQAVLPEAVDVGTDENKTLLYRSP
jgi:hypothetical protein